MCRTLFPREHTLGMFSTLEEVFFQMILSRNFLVKFGQSDVKNGLNDLKADRLTMHDPI